MPCRNTTLRLLFGKMEDCLSGLSMVSRDLGCFENNAVALDPQALPFLDDIQLRTWKPRWACHGNVLEAPIESSVPDHIHCRTEHLEHCNCSSNSCEEPCQLAVDCVFSCNFCSAVHRHAQRLEPHEAQVDERPEGPRSPNRCNVAYGRIAQGYRAAMMTLAYARGSQYPFPPTPSGSRPGLRLTVSAMPMTA